MNPTRSMRELRAIVAEDTARFQRIADIWHELTVEEQKELVHRAEAMHVSDLKDAGYEAEV